jgi:sugar (pentulose or hexulose) kinase
MPELLRCVPDNTLITGWDFSTQSVKCQAFDLAGRVVARVQEPTERITTGGVSELDLDQLRDQARRSARDIAAKLRDAGRLADWLAGAISATHHTAGRIDAAGNPVRRAICWDDQTLAPYHAAGLARLGGQDRARELTGGPWAVRYSLSHLVKDETTLDEDGWRRTRWILPHGPLATGYLTGRFDCISVSSAASTGLLDLDSETWSRGMLDALESPAHRDLAWSNLPALIGMSEPVESVAGLDGAAPLIFPTLDDQAAGLVGGGAVDAGELAVIRGTSAVVNASAASPPRSGHLDVMKLNWGNYLWMRCFTNGAGFVDEVAGANPNWAELGLAAAAVPAGCGGVSVLPFAKSEPALGVAARRVEWDPREPAEPGVRLRAAYEAVAYLIARAVAEHESAAGKPASRISVSGGMARSPLMCEILASVLGRPIDLLESDEGPALGAAVAALAGLETHLRKARGIAEPFRVADAVAAMVRFRPPVLPRPEWAAAYRDGLRRFEERVRG